MNRAQKNKLKILDERKERKAKWQKSIPQHLRSVIPDKWQFTK